jgi:hypothetical protein
MIDLEINSFGAEEAVESQVRILNEQIKETEDEINKILAVKRPKNKKIEDMPRTGAKYALLVSNLEVLKSRLSLYTGHLDLENITHSSQTASSSSSSKSSKSSSSSSKGKTKSKSKGKSNKRTRKSKSEDTLDMIDNLEF